MKVIIIMNYNMKVIINTILISLYTYIFYFKFNIFLINYYMVVKWIKNLNS